MIKQELTHLFKNKLLLVVMVVIMLIPAIYAGLFLNSMWDPYGEIGKLPVAVVNNDATIEHNGKMLAVGDNLESSLKTNNAMNFIITDEENADKGLKNGDYYMVITIPEDFSKSLTSIITQDIEKGNIIYTVNEKINAIAPKLTDKGASAIQEKVSKAVVETASDAIFGVGKDLGTELENQLPRLNNIYNQLLEVQSQFSNINDVVNLAGDGADKLKTLISDIQNDIPLITETLENSQKLGTNLEEFLSTSKSNLNNIAPVIKNDIKILNEIANEISYENKMVQGKPTKLSQVERSRWINSKGKATNQQFVPENVTALARIMKKRHDDGKSLDQMFVISPFRAVVNGITNKLPKEFNDGAITKEWLKEHVGTVHTFQGKEADVVFLIIGTDQDTDGGADWAFSKPNLLNVAVTRARHVFYLIVDYYRLKNKPYAEVGARQLPLLDN